MTESHATTEPCGCGHACTTDPSTLRPASVRSALRLEYVTVAWNVAEGVIAILAALAAGSVAILGFGIDSFVECASALVMIWRLRAEHAHRLPESRLHLIEQRARRMVAGSLFLLGGYVAFDAVETLWTKDQPNFSIVGSVLLVVSICLMIWLARAKRRLAHDLHSHALEADAFQSTACWWLSIAALTGVGLNGLLGWWWADPIAALVISALLVKEGREAWQGKACC
jgi:divalent metal cation (Fe/Co/Zn/Cd) transporter